MITKKYNTKIVDSFYSNNESFWESSMIITFDDDKNILSNFSVDDQSKFIDNKIVNHGASIELFNWLHLQNSSGDLGMQYCRSIQNKYKCPSIFTAVNVGKYYVELVEKDIVVIVTAGVKTNAISAGKDPVTSKKSGTINIIIIIDHVLTPAAEQQLFMNITEAKTGALFDLNISSSYSNNLATGTGTDSLVIVSNRGLDKPLQYVGGHSDTAVKCTRLVREAVKQAIIKNN